MADLNIRLADTVIVLILPLLAISLAIPPKRSQSSLGVILGIIMLVAYHKLEQYGSRADSLSKTSTVLLIWTPFLLLSLLTLRMYWVIANVPAGEPIGSLQRFLSGSAQLAWRLLGSRPPAAAGGPET